LKSLVFNPVLLLLALTGVAAADLPKKAPLSRYVNLWTNSPFTSKPPPPEAGPENNPLDDYALIGVSPINDNNGYRVTLINKKKPDERITVDSDETVSGFKILGVTRKPGDPLGTVVRMSSGSMTGTVSFEENLLTVAAAKAPPQAAPPQVPGQPPQPVPPGQAQPLRQPRPRVIPPPSAPQAGAAAQPTAPQSSQRPFRRSN
jgi:hypothetical protein